MGRGRPTHERDSRRRGGALLARHAAERRLSATERLYPGEIKEGESDGEGNPAAGGGIVGDYHAVR